MERIRYLVMDVDGTLTDGKIYMGDNGELFKAFNIKDGYGIHDLLPPAQIKPVIITGRESRILEKRCKEIGIEIVLQSQKEKMEALKNVLSVDGGKFCEVAYIGDDINDLPCMLVVKESGGIIGCPVDAADKIQEMSDFISTKKGGDGAVREFIEYLILL